MNIWVPKTKILEPKQDLILPSNRVSGYFKIEGRLADGRRRLIADWQPNLITDGGLDRWGDGAPITHCCVGSGNTTPAISDSALVSHIASIGVVLSSSGAQSSPPYYGWGIINATFSPPGADHNLSEIGWAWASGGGSLWSRALIKNAGGTPTTISWLAAETLIVTYEVRTYPPLTDAEVSTTISGDVYDVVIRAAGINSANYWVFNGNQARIDYARDGALNFLTAYSGAIGANTGIPGYSGRPGETYAYGGWISTPAYSAGSHKRTGTASWAPASANYVAGIPSLFTQPRTGAYQMAFTPAIPKTNTETLTLTVSTTVWGRYT